MITISLVNIHHHIYLEFFFLVMKTFKVSCLKVSSQ